MLNQGQVTRLGENWVRREVLLRGRDCRNCRAVRGCWKRTCERAPSQPLARLERALLSLRDLQECVRQGDLAHVLHERVVQEIAVDEEKDGQINFFTGQDPLLFEAEALDFGKVGCDLVRT